MSIDEAVNNTLDFLSGGGEMGERMRGLDWSATTLGPPTSWPQALRTSVRLMLGTNHPVFIFWGDDHTCLYNDAYSGSIGPEKHPAMLGAPGRSMWEEIWPVIGPQIDQVMSGGGATWHEDQLIPILRHGSLQDVYWTYGYSPIDHEDGIGGVLVICTETTERIRTEREQTEGLARLLDLVKQAPGFVAVLSGRRHRFELVNDEYRSLFTGGADIVGKTVAEVFPEVVGQGFVALLDQVFQTGKPYIGRSVPLTIAATESRPLSEVVLDFIYKGIKGQGGQIEGVFVQGYDVTDRMRAQEALQKSEERYRDLVQNQTEMICRFQLDGRVLFANDSYARSVGLPVDDFQDANLWDYIPKAEQDAVRTQLLSLTPESRQVQIENSLVTRSGIRHMLWTNRAINFDEDGQILEAQSMGMDITDRVRAEQSLRESESRFRKLADQAPVMVWMSDAQGDCVYLSNSWCRHTGVAEAAGLGTGWLGKVHPDDQDMVRQKYAQARESNQGFRIEYRLQFASGGFGWVLDTAAPRAETGHAFEGLVGSIVDIDDRRRHEDQKSLLLDELNHRVKNTLAVVQGLARQTFRPGRDVVVLRSNFEARLSALAAAHGLLTSSEWRSTSLRNLMQSTLDVTGGTSGRFSLSGPEVLLEPQVALSVAMALHELCTNALKYGALSSQSGKVDLSWSVDETDPLQPVRIVWKETGGPPVTPPEERGFGSIMIERALQQQIRGDVSLSFEPEGVVCVIEFPQQADS